MKTADLNLLRVLEAVLSAGSVTAAAERLHLSVPATSHALARLRDAVGDPLLVRAGRRLVPTPRAQAMREPVSQLLAQAQALLGRPTAADLSTLAREFVVRSPDAFAIAFGPALVGALQATMPRAQIHFVSESFDDATALREGRVDIDLGHFRPREPELQTVALFQMRQAAVVRRGHPLAAHAVTARRYAAASHIAVRARAQAPSAVDALLAQQGLVRRVVVTVAHANLAPILAARSDLVATVTERMAQAMAPSLGLEVLALPFVREPDTLVMAWHPRHEADAAHAWLRAQLRHVVVAARR